MKPPTPRTPLDDAEPLTGEELSEAHKEWFHRTLDTLYFTAMSDAGMKKAFQDKAKSLASDKHRCASGRYLLLIDYAQAKQAFGGDSKRIYERLIKHHVKRYGLGIGVNSMKNLVSESITMALNGELRDLPDWVLEVVKETREKYTPR